MIKGDAGAGVDDVEFGNGAEFGVFRLSGAEDEFGCTGLFVLLRVRGRAIVGGHGVGGVDEEVEDGLLEAGDIELDGDGSRGEFGTETDGAVVGLGQVEVDEFLDDGVELGGGGFETEFSGEAEEVGEDVAEAIGLASEDLGASSEA